MAHFAVTATHLPTGEVARTLGPFLSLSAAWGAVAAEVGQALKWERVDAMTHIVEVYPLLWTIEDQDPPGHPRLPVLDSPS